MFGKNLPEKFDLRKFWSGFPPLFPLWAPRSPIRRNTYLLNRKSTDLAHRSFRIHAWHAFCY